MSAQDAKDELAAGPGESTTSGYITPEDFERAFDIIYRDVAASDLEDLNDIVGLVGDTVLDIQNLVDLKKKSLTGGPALIRPPSLDQDADTYIQALIRNTLMWSFAKFGEKLADLATLRTP